MIKAEVLADSKNEFGNRITTMRVTFPRIILAELNTHRMLSRNSASSRAIPFERMIEMVKTSPFIPIAWQKNHSGMQGVEYLSDRDREVCLSAWLQARNLAVQQALHLAERGLTKQLVNRGLETYMYHTAIVTATEWENFFALRCPQYKLENPPVDGEYFYRSRKDFIYYCLGVTECKSWSEEQWLLTNKGQAEIHMMALAEAMWDARNESEPKLLKAGEWHIPDEQRINETYHLDQHDTDMGSIPVSAMVGTMLCARVSYTTLNTDLSEWTLNKMIESYDKLRLSKPMHASPFEHCAMAMTKDQLNQFASYQPRGWDGTNGQKFFTDVKEEGQSGNLRGFIQLRKMIPNENVTE